MKATEAFITCLDSLKLDMVSADALQPLASDLCDALRNVHVLPPSWDGMAKVRAWLFKLTGMAAHEELSEEDSRQMVFDLETAYEAFKQFL